MEKEYNLYQDINTRTHGTLYLGIVGPVRSGKSTFIRNFMETAVLPQMEEAQKKQARDELPLSGNGKMITTMEPKFIPQQGADFFFKKEGNLKLRMIDCVGYVIPGAEGLDEKGEKRLVKTPWSDQEMSFSDAAHMGTGKVISDHATVGLVITADGSFGEFKREDYETAEKEIVSDMKKSKKPFLMILNTAKPYTDQVKQLARRMEEAYGSAVLPLNVLQLNESDIDLLLEKLLDEFPVTQIKVEMPGWVEMLSYQHPIKKNLIHILKEHMKHSAHMRQREGTFPSDYVKSSFLTAPDFADGTYKIQLLMKENCYFSMISEMFHEEIKDDYQFMSLLKNYAVFRNQYANIARGMEEVKQKGYGVIPADLSEIQIQEPEIIHQGNKFGVKIKASSPSIHLIRTEVETELAPIVGEEAQANQLIAFMKKESEEKNGMWEITIFGKTVGEMITDSMKQKLAAFDETAQAKLQDALKKIINESKGRMICILL